MKEDRLEWFKCRQSRLLGALAALQPDEGYIYCIVLFRIYEVNGPCPDDARALSLRTNMPVRRVEHALGLLTTGTKPKLRRTDAGLVNDFAEEELEDRLSMRESRQKSGKKGAYKRWQKTEEKQEPSNGKSHSEMRLDQPELESELESSVPNGTDAGASLLMQQPSAPVYTDAKHELWGEGVPILEQLGIGPKRSRPMIGRWLRDSRNDAVTVMAAIRRARENRVIDPVPWITRAIAAGPKGGKSTGGNGFARLLARDLTGEGEDHDGQTIDGTAVDLAAGGAGGPRGEPTDLFPH